MIRRLLAVLAVLLPLTAESISPGDTQGDLPVMKKPLYFWSEAKSFVADANLSFRGFVPRKGPRGGRMVIDTFWLVVDFDDINVATTAVDGEDFWRAFQRIQVSQIDGKLRWNLRGDESRIAAFGMMPSTTVPDFADSGTTTNQALEIMVPIPMAKPYAHNPTDYSLPADVFGELVIQCANLAELGVAGGTVTVDAATYYVVAECHEENGVQLKAEDKVDAFQLPATTGGRIVVGGRIQDLFLFARGAAGGAALTNLTSARIEGILNRATVRDPDLTELFLRARGAAHNGTTAGAATSLNPFANTRACAVVWTDGDRCVDGPALDELVLELSNSVSSLIAIKRVVTTRSADIAAAVSRLYQIPPQAWRIKTYGKSRRDPGRWSRAEQAFLPLVAPMTRAA